MKIVIDNIQLSFDGHRSLVHAHIRPGWLFRLLGPKKVPLMFIGHGTQWLSYPDHKPIAKKMANQLSASEKTWAHVKRMNPCIDLAEIARTVNKKVNQ